ncbi:TPA: hypothetical protein ACPSKY_003492 [Legionella bozemanae]|uniref:Uncharacterized protein n=2 Tax=Legionellaceae TaxID=444 RepID=A8QYS5_9GAMM|nr:MULTISPECIES: hypothetical protein [Legionellaceae]KTC67859.1 hypothetical protein Lboz_3502 [Legionella bozemanae]MCW8485168.1 RecX family transcriptional regulator [Fluoribacter dumoffii]BAF92660.1 hypothetical protein [Fluoribacter dumoffii Tex-KL]STP13948.1 Uncharacterised protein [Legionella bozemanae]
MSSHSIKMLFILQEEVARLGNASDYELFILKSHIEQIIYTKRKLESLTSQISVGSSLLYFDAQLLKEDILLVTELGALIKGIRQSDKQSICVEPQSFNFDHKTTISLIAEKRTRIHDEWKLPSYHRVIVDCHSYVLKGYFIKYNHNGCKLKLLGGETVKLPASALFYEPTKDDLKDFMRIEQDPHHQNLEYERTLKAVRSKIGQLDPSNNPIDYRKLLRFMTGRGYLLHYIEKAIEETYGKRQEKFHC